MPKVRRSRKAPPDGWELIEPTLEELEQKMREGLFIFLFSLDALRGAPSNALSQPKEYSPNKMVYIPFCLLSDSLCTILNAFP